MRRTYRIPLLPPRRFRRPLPSGRSSLRYFSEQRSDLSFETNLIRLNRCRPSHRLRHSTLAAQPYKQRLRPSCSKPLPCGFLLGGSSLLDYCFPPSTLRISRCPSGGAFRERAGAVHCRRRPATDVILQTPNWRVRCGTCIRTARHAAQHCTAAAAASRWKSFRELVNPDMRCDAMFA